MLRDPTTDRSTPPTCSTTPSRRRASCPTDEGLLLHRYARERLPHGPVLEVGTYCGKSAIYLGAAAPQSRSGGTRLHRRPPPRVGGEPGRLGAPRPHAGRPRARADGHAARRSGARSPAPASRTTSSPSSAAAPPWPRTGARRCRCCSSTAGTPRSTPRTTTPAGRTWLMTGGLLVDPRRVPGPRGRRAAAVPRLPAGARRPAPSRRSRRVGSMRVLRA